MNDCRFKNFFKPHAKSFRLISLLLAIFLISCKSVGPQQINIDRSRYNVALQETQNQELLTNIVRLRYYEPISFLQVTGVTASYSLSPSLSASPGISYVNTNPPMTTSNLTVTPGVNYTDSPTISYVPVTSSDFINQLLAPVQLNQLSYLTYGGIHDTDLIFKLLIESINDIENASSITDSKIEFEPEYKKYYKILSLFQKIGPQGALRFIPVQLDGNATVAIRILKPFMHSPDIIKLRKLLELPQNTSLIVFANKPNLAKGVIGVQIRSILGMMAYLSHSVQAPPDDLKNGSISLYHLPNGEVYDWGPMLQGLTTIYSSKTEPQDVFVKVYLHNHWFYIKDNDLDSKKTFSFLSELLVLSTGGAMNPPASAPILTIPTR